MRSTSSIPTPARRSKTPELKRAGMDYWRLVEWRRWPDWNLFRAQLQPDARLWFVESHGTRRYTDVRFQAGDYLVFGRETAGLGGIPKSSFPILFLLGSQKIPRQFAPPR